MPRETFLRELQKLQDDVLVLGSMVEQAIQASVAALKARDLDSARRIIEADLDINRKRFEIEENCLVLIATQHPMAGDLRAIAAVLEIATDLERMGDYAKGISRINLMLGTRPLLKPLIDIPRMADIGCNLLRRALDAFVQRDVEAAREIPKEDDQVDALYNQVYHELLGIILANPATLDDANHLLWVAHNLERFSDRVTNICERVVFTVTGEMKELDVKEEGVLGV